jgi:hypothetical protein
VGASLIEAMLTPRVAVLLEAVPSFTVKLTLRLVVVGLSEALL